MKGSEIKSNPVPGSQYFEGNRKGEVNELRVLLKNIINDKDDKKKREVVKKVIAYMTLGIDVSRLFTEMCMASYTNDIIQKKMIYLYLTTYAESHPDLAIMAISTFQKDCQHLDAKIRGLAVRNMCSLRFSGAFEYMLPCIREALKDIDSYVRKTAIMGCVKLYFIQADAVKGINHINNEESDIVDSLYKMIKDNDPLVIMNSIEALNEILAGEGGMALSSKMIVYLLNRAKEFNEWGQTVILDLLGRFQPKSDTEMFDIMNLLEDRLKHSCSAIVLGTLKVFMNFTKDKPKIYQQVVERARAPLITLASTSEISGSYEVTFTILSHIHYITSKGYNEVFEKDYKIFYCKADEPTYNKFLKLQILADVASESNLGDMLNELGEYVTDVDSELSRRSIQALGCIAVRLTQMTSAIVKQLCSFVSLQKEYITNEVIIVFKGIKSLFIIKDILRKQSNQITDIIEIVNQTLDLITDPASKVALIYILGEFGKDIPLAPYLLENYVGSLRAESLEVKHALVTAAVKLFLKRAPEMQPILAKLFTQILDEQNNEDIDLKDRTVFYYRALQQNVQEVKTLLNNQNAVTEKFWEEQQNKNDQLQVEFNTLAVIFQKLESKFIKSYEYFYTLKNKELQEETAQQLQAEDEQNATKAPTEVEQPSLHSQASNDLLDIDQSQQQPISNQISGQDLMNVDFGAQVHTVRSQDLVQGFELDEELFEQGWTNLNDGATINRMLGRIDQVTEQNIEQLFKSNNISNIASGEEDGVMKMYFYGRLQTQQSNIYIELEVSKITSTVQMSTKCENEDYSIYVSKFIEDFLRNSQIIQ